MANIEALLGRTIERVIVNRDSDVIDFHLADGGHFQMYHRQDCCESVSIEDIEGNIQSLVGNPILVAEESSNSDNPKTETWGSGYVWTDESHTWTFYKLATIQGHVDIRWYGSSNGYYSESVSFKDMNNDSDWGW